MKDWQAQGYRSLGGAWVHIGAALGQEIILEPGAVIGAGVVLGDRTWVGAHAVIKGPAVFGTDNKIYSGAVLGEGPQDISHPGEATRLQVGDANIFREFSTVHRGSVKGGGVTTIGSHNFFMVGCHVGHDSLIEDHVVLSNGVMIAGHCHIQSWVNIAGGVAIVQFTTVGRYAFIGGLSGTTMDLEPYLSHDGLPARPRGVNVVALRRHQFAPQTIDALKEAYRTLFSGSKKGGERLERVREDLEQRGAMCSEVEELLNFMQKSRMGRFGRMLQGPAGVDSAPRIANPNAGVSPATQL